MESPRLSLLSSSSPKLVMGYPTLLKNPTTPKFSISTTRPSLPFPHITSKTVPHTSRISISALSQSHGPRRTSKNGSEYFASISSSSGQQTASVGVNPQSVSPPPSQIGSPLFWVGVGVALSAIFSWVATRLKNYAMQQAFKSLTEQMNTQNNQFNPAFSARSPFPFSPPPASQPATSPFRAASQPAVTVDIPATKVEAAPVTDAIKEKETDILEEREIKEEPKKYAFVDVSPEETSLNTPFSSVEDVNDTSSSKDVQFAKEASQNGAAFKPGPGASEGSQSSQKTGSFLSVEALEKMMDDPTVQKMVYPYLPEEMRNPTTFKWMLQNPQYRQQLEEMLNNMSGSSEWDSRMVDSLKNFDLSSPEVKQQFDQIGLTPEEVISKIMANPDVALAFQNPRVQQAIMECSQNPLSIAKYQNDKEVMDVFNKISEILG
uniref:Protein TIC 40, chloroplastic n=1 Tax=Salix viminalis TaxID=40686 RepID=A0A6N2N9W7_SALVM